MYVISSVVMSTATPCRDGASSSSKSLWLLAAKKFHMAPACTLRKEASSVFVSNPLRYFDGGKAQQRSQLVFVLSETPWNPQGSNPSPLSPHDVVEEAISLGRGAEAVSNVHREQGRRSTLPMLLRQSVKTPPEILQLHTTGIFPLVPPFSSRGGACPRLTC